MSQNFEKIIQEYKESVAAQTTTQTYDLFNNPMVTAAREALSQEDIELYKKKGEEMYAIDFEKSGENGVVYSEPVERVIGAIDVDLSPEGNSEEKYKADAAIFFQQISALIRSGLHPSYLTREEKDFLTSYKGEDWFLDFGYLKNDLNRINL